MRAQLRVVREGEGASESQPVLRGYATTYGEPYEMYDMFGPYTEVVEPGAGAVSLAAGPDVKYLFNHAGVPMARTLGPETLQLSEDDHGLMSVAYPEMDLQISREVVTMVARELVDEMSFAFVIKRGLWSPDWTQYTIKEYDIHRGDTAPVTYGANPHTEIAVERAVDDTQGDRRTLSAEDQQRARRILARTLVG
jgi:HK97 family phage prohead protease